jgi:hypothetical protein
LIKIHDFQIIFEEDEFSPADDEEIVDGKIEEEAPVKLDTKQDAKIKPLTFADVRFC